jgi:hypothetical protein
MIPTTRFRPSSMRGYRTPFALYSLVWRLPFEKIVALAICYRQVGGFSFDFCYSQERFGALIFVLTRVSQMPATC